MKCVVKGAEPGFFQTWKRKNPVANWADFIGTVEHSHLRQYLINEQGMFCPYCEVALKDGAAHIEHFRPRWEFRAEMFHIQNLFACCQHTDSCGHAKADQYFDGLISPLDPDCESRFTYTDDGRIIPSHEGDTTAERTISILALNCNRLRDRRRSIIRALDETDLDFLQHCMSNCIEWYHGFLTVVQYVAHKRA